MEQAIARRTRFAGACWLALLAALVLVPSIASASLSDEATRVADTWRAAGLRVRSAGPLFLEQGKMRRVLLQDEELGPDRETCTTVVFLSPRSLEFQVRTGSITERQPRPDRSLAGVATLRRCGAAKSELAAILIEMRSMRGVVEILVAHGTREAPAPTTALPERVVVAARPMLDPGRALSNESMNSRLIRIEQRARDDGASAFERHQVRTTEEGSGRMELGLREGCHRIEILADRDESGRVYDVDAELRDDEASAVLSRDRSDTADARLETCIGEAQGASLMFTGAPAGVRVMVLDARWRLPEGLPSTWPARARGAVAAALARRRAPIGIAAPIAEGTGVAGATSIPLELEPGSCYLAVAAANRGEMRHISITTSIEGRVYRDDSGPGRDGVAVAFCTRRTERTTARVEARGAGIIWTSALFKTGRASLDEPQP